MMPTLRMANSSSRTSFVADRREDVSGGPILGTILGAPINGVCFERFECDSSIPEIFVVQLVKIIEADIDIKATAPMILDALVDDMASRQKSLMR